MNQLIRDDFVLQDEYITSHATIEDCLSHRTGMPGHVLTFGGDSPRESVRNLRHLFIDKELRSGFEYCNIMYIAVSHMLEVVTGEWLGSFLQKRIYEPLEMNHTFFTCKDAHRYIQDEDTNIQFARPYVWDTETSSQKELPYWNIPSVSGAGSMVSNVLDYAKYVRSMIEKTGPLSKEAHADLLKPRAFLEPFDVHFPTLMMYGLGWFTGIYHGEHVVHHSGMLEGFTANIIYLPERKWGVIAMCNQAGPGRGVLIWHLVDEYLKVPSEKRVDLFAL
jgi:CubicO group peptidase (beta-lactamase class C family)